jgi:hypothetical protein
MDQLYDILSQLPGLWEDINMASSEVLPHAAASGHGHQVGSLMNQIREWRKKWDTMNPDTASLYILPSKGVGREEGNELQTLVNDILRREIRFQTFDQALALLVHNAAVIYLARLAELAGCAGSPLSFDIDQLRCHLLEKNGRPSSPLVQSAKGYSPWQLTIEAVQISGYFARELRVMTPSDLVPLAPVGILYCAAKTLPLIGEHLSAAVAVMFSASVLPELEMYGIWEEKDRTHSLKAPTDL